MITIRKLLEKKMRREKIVMLTAYDYPPLGASRRRNRT